MKLKYSSPSSPKNSKLPIFTFIHSFTLLSFLPYDHWSWMPKNHTFQNRSQFINNSINTYNITVLQFRVGGEVREHKNIGPSVGKWKHQLIAHIYTIQSFNQQQIRTKKNENEKLERKSKNAYLVIKIL